MAAPARPGSRYSGQRGVRRRRRISAPIVEIATTSPSTTFWTVPGGNRRERRLRGERALAGRNRSSMRISLRMADRSRHAIDQLVGRRMLHPLGLVMDAIPGIAECMRQIRFDDAVAADRAQRGATAA